MSLQFLIETKEGVFGLLILFFLTSLNGKAHAVTWKMTPVQHLFFFFLGILLAPAGARVCEDLKLAQPLFSNISLLPSQDSASVMLRNLVFGSCKVQEYTEEAESLENEFRISEANINALAGARANAQLPKPDTRSPCSSLVYTALSY